MTETSATSPAKRSKGWSISILFSAGLLFVLFYNLDARILAELAARLEPQWLALAGLSYFLTFWTRGLRYLNLLDSQNEKPHSKYLHLSLMHHLYLIILPAKAGELIFPWLGHAILQSSRTLNLLALLIIRLFDFCFIFVFISWGLFFALLPNAPAMLYPVVTLLAIVFLLLGIREQIIVGGAAKILSVLKNQRIKPGLFARLHSQLLEANELLRARRHGKHQLSLFFWTAMSWLASALGLWSLFKVFGYSIEPQVLIFLLGGINIIGILGFFTIGGLGITELGLAGMLILLGFDTQSAIALGLGVRLGIVVISLLVIVVSEAALSALRTVIKQ